MQVAIDAMGGDHAPRVVVEGAVEAVQTSGVAVTLVGPAHMIQDALAQIPGSHSLDIRVVDAAEVVGMGESPVQALRRKRSASIRVAAELVARGEADALYSAGNTGATVLAARQALGLLTGAERPALTVTVPTRTGTAVLLDVGANVDCRPGHLLTFAIMGLVYARVALGLQAPRVGLLSIGEEAGKGNRLVRQTFGLLRESGLPFVGNVEARDVYSGVADVVVCDGFTGNIAIKVSEALVELVAWLVAGERGGDHAVGTLVGAIRQRLDREEFGGAPVLGIGGACVVGHGRATATAVRHGIVMAHQMAADGLVARIQTDIVGIQGRHS